MNVYYIVSLILFRDEKILKWVSFGVGTCQRVLVVPNPSELGKTFHLSTYFDDVE